MSFFANLFKTAQKIKDEESKSESQIILPSPPIFTPAPKPIIAFKENDEPEYRYIDNGEDFVRAILGDFSFKVEIVMGKNSERFEILSKNFSGRVSHPGFIYYLAYCWGKEVGIVLRPDIIWSCVLFEFSKHISETKDKYFNDFKDLYRGEKNAYNGYMTTYDLVDKFRSYIKYDEFYDMITKERFENEPKNFTEIKILSFCNFMRVKYKKYKLNCKIPKFKIKGDKEDWEKLIGLLDYLIHLIGDRFFINYLENIKSLVSNIVANGFQVMLNEPKLRYQGLKEMIKDIFYIKDGSVKGWGKELYFDSYMNPSRKWELDSFNTHMSYIPYINVKEREACMKVGGMCYSVMDGDCLEPMYGSALCKINDVKIYNKLVNLDKF